MTNCQHEEEYRKGDKRRKALKETIAPQIMQEYAVYMFFTSNIFKKNISHGVVQRPASEWNCSTIGDFHVNLVYEPHDVPDFLDVLKKEFRKLNKGHS